MEKFEVSYLEAQLEIGKAVIESMQELIPKKGTDRGGYLQVSLYDKKRKKKTCKVHRLIGLTFLRTVEGKDEINHID